MNKQEVKDFVAKYPFLLGLRVNPESVEDMSDEELYDIIRLINQFLNGGGIV